MGQCYNTWRPKTKRSRAGGGKGGVEAPRQRNITRERGCGERSGKENIDGSREMDGDNDAEKVSNDDQEGIQGNNEDSDGKKDPAEGDLPGYVTTPEERRMWSVYGDLVHANDGCCLV